MIEVVDSVGYFTWHRICDISALRELDLSQFVRQANQQIKANMSNEKLRNRGIAAAQMIKAFGGMLAGAVLIYLGASGKVIPKGGLHASAKWGMALGDDGVRGLAIGMGVLAMVVCALWMRAAIRRISRNR